MFSVFHPLPSKIPYPKHPRGSYRKTYSTFKNYDARNATFKHLQLFEISSYLSTKHPKLTSLHLFSSPYQKIFTFSPPSIQNPLSKTPQGSYRKTYSTLKNYDARNATFKHLQLFEVSSYLSTKHLKLTYLHLSSSPYQNMFNFSSPSIQNPLSQTPSGSYRKTYSTF